MATTGLPKHDIAREQEARVAEHQAEQPDNPASAGIVGKVDDEAGKIDLCLNAWGCLEAHLVGLRLVLRSDRGQEAFHRRIGANIAELANLAERSAQRFGRFIKGRAFRVIPAYWVTLTLLIVAINGWNRIQVGFAFGKLDKKVLAGECWGVLEYL